MTQHRKKKMKKIILEEAQILSLLDEDYKQPVLNMIK